MDRLIKRYENRKMYDTTDGSYVSLDDIKKTIRNGETIKVIDNNSEEDITVHTLTQIVLEESKNGRNPFSSDLLHNAIRWSNNMIDEGIEHVKHQLDEFMPKSLHNFLNRRAEKTTDKDIDELHKRVEQLEESIKKLSDSD